VSSAADPAGAIVAVAANVLGAGLVGFRVLFSRAAGAGDTAAAANLRRVMVRAALLVSSAMAAVLIVAGPALLRTVGGSEQVAEAGFGYLVLRAATLPLLASAGVLASVAGAHRRTSIVLVGAAVTAVLNLGLDWALVFGAGPLPELGPTGDGVATFVATAVGLVTTSALLRRQVPLPAASQEPRRGADVADLLRLSWAPIVSALLDYLAALVIMAMLARLGQAAVAPVRVVFEVHSLIFGVVFGFSTGVMITLGRLAGGNDRTAILAARRNSLHVLLLIGTLLGAVLFTAPSFVAGLFLGDETAVAAATPGVRIIALACPVLAAALYWVARLRAAKGLVQEMRANLASVICVQVPVAFLGLLTGRLDLFVWAIGAFWLCRFAVTVALTRSLEARCPA
jgi:Na+-driven multidrug efflux pump